MHYGKIGFFRRFCALSHEAVVLERNKDLFLNGLGNSFRMMYGLARFDSQKRIPICWPQNTYQEFDVMFNSLWSLKPAVPLKKLWNCFVFRFRGLVEQGLTKYIVPHFGDTFGPMLVDGI